MINLPINDVIADIQHALNKHNRVILQAPPGAGKTTAVPIALLSQSWLKEKQIIVLEPRRIAARNAAARMASLLNESIGKTIGYQIRQENCFSEKTKILVITEGILTKKLQADPELKNIALVIFDEFHERNLHADLSLALCQQSQNILNPEIKILIMSATINTSAISDLLCRDSTTHPPVIKSTGRSFPVDIRHILYPVSNNLSQQQQLILNLFNITKKVIHEHDGNCLIFLPGIREIKHLESKINDYLYNEKIDNIYTTTLYGNLNRQQQDQAIHASRPGTRKLVLSTNIAETSITIEGINCVIDSGLERVLYYNPSSGLNKLKTQFISADSATQRSGRAGRLSPGVCYRLWSDNQHRRLLKHSQAEILHADLSGFMLELAKWGIKNINELSWIDPPPENAALHANKLLQRLSALDSGNKITRHGEKILQLGCHPRLAHMMLCSIDMDLTYQACLISALLTENDIFKSGVEKSIDINDRLQFLSTINHIDKRYVKGVDISTCKRIISSANDYLKRVERYSDKKIRNRQISPELSGVLLAYAYFDRIARQRSPDSPHYLLSSGKGAITPDFLNQSLYSCLVAASLDNKGAEATIYLAAQISENHLQEYFCEQIEITEEMKWNEKLLRVESRQLTTIGQIILQQSISQQPARDDVLKCLLSAMKKSGLSCLNWSAQALNLKQRIQFIHHQLHSGGVTESTGSDALLPDFSDAYLLATLEIWLLPYLNTQNSFKECQKLDLYSILSSQLSWPQLQYIDKQAPETIAVPSGSSVRIDYSDPSQAVLAVRLQEVFGLHETPTLLGGQCKVMMHLLSPARRPMQVTQDLSSFWKTAYHEIKKELRGKYKRHYWPDDPLTATATSKTKKQMNR